MKIYRHEIGADITGLLKLLVIQNFIPYNQIVINYAPIYYLTYRYHIKKSNILFGIGGLYSSRENGPFVIDRVENNIFSIESNLSLRIGYERVFELSRKWQTYIGIDFRPTIIRSSSPIGYYNFGYVEEQFKSYNIYGIAPVIGFRYRLSKRVSILTEMSIAFNLESQSSKSSYYSADLKLYPNKPDLKAVVKTNYMASFLQPIFLVLTFDL